MKGKSESEREKKKKMDKQVEREMRAMKEEMESRKIKIRLEKERREKSERKIQEMTEYFEVTKGKQSTWQKEVEEMREATDKKDMETRQRSGIQRRRQEVRKERRDIVQKDSRIIRESRDNRAERKKGESGCKVWENKEDSIRDWMEDIMEGVNWELEDTLTDDTKKVIFRTKEDMEKIWEKRAEIKERGKIRLEQWLTYEERKAKAIIMREKRKREEAAEEEGEPDDQEQLIAEVRGERYIWDEEKERIVKGRGKGAERVEEERRKRWREDDLQEEEEV